MFRDMFTARSDAATATSIVERALHTPREIGEKMLLDLMRYDATRLATSLAELRAPFLAIQATYANEKRERRSLSKGQTTPFLDMLRVAFHHPRIEIIADSGHFRRSMSLPRSMHCFRHSSPNCRYAERNSQR